METLSPSSEELLAEHLRLVGTITALWAQLEAFVDYVIWEIVDAPHGLIAAVTSQVGSTHAKFRVLLSLLDTMEASESLKKKVRVFDSEMNPLLEKRNRAVHDDWVVNALSSMT